MVSVTIKVTLPKKEFASKKWLDSIASAQKKGTVKQLKKLFNDTVFGWSKKPDFGWAQTKSSDEIAIRVYAQGEHADIYALVDAGSPPHTIKPKQQRGTLSFQPGYRAATRPGTLLSRRKYRSGKAVFTPSVQHPGFTPRKFGVMAAEAYARDFAMEMQEAVSKAAK